MRLYGFGQTNDCVDENTNVGRARAGRNTVFGAATGGLVLERQRDHFSYDIMLPVM